MSAERRIRQRRSFGALYWLALVVALLLAAVPVFADDTSGGGVTPTYYPNWQSGNAAFECSVIGYSYGYKVDAPAPDGTWNIDAVPNTVTISNSDGKEFDWSSTLGMDAVIIKAGTGANVYEYDPERTFDIDVKAPEGKQVSHVTFCWDYELTARKTADGTYDREITWELTKSVTPDQYTGFAGDTFGPSTWTVKATKTEVEKNFKVAGDITVSNPTPFNVTFSVEDEVNGTTAPVICPTYNLVPAQSVICTYELMPNDRTATLNTAEVSVSSSTGTVGGATATSPITWIETVIGDESVTVDDDRNPAGFPAAIDKTTEWTYEEWFSCSSEPGDYTNGKDEDSYINKATATGTTTNLAAEDQVDVTCYAPVISKTANTYYERDWTWTIEKSADQTSLTLSLGQMFTVNYDVDVSATKTDSAFNVSGVITVGNPNPDADLVVDLADVFGDGTVPVITPDADCNLVGGVLTVPAGGTATCDYTADVANADAGTNTATATLNEIDFTATEPYTFGAPDVERDECIDVTDSLRGFLGVACIDEELPKSFEYSLDIGPYNVCGDYTVDNTASFVTNDTGATGEDTWTVDVNVPCGTGCTLTQGYWKTHSSYGPAPYDDTWAQLPNGADTIFFLSGVGYYKVLWTPPAGNPYYTLAHQYIAAQLNMLNGASVPADVQTAFDDATALFNTYTPAQVDGSKSIQRSFKRLVGTLDDYNNGLTGPGHCSEDVSSAREFERFAIYRSAARYLIVPELRGR